MVKNEIDEDIRLCTEIIFKIPADKRPRCLIFGKNNYVLSSEKVAKGTFSLYPQEDLIGKDLSDRGAVLEIFTMMEYIINELLVLFIEPQKITELKEVLIYVNYGQKIRYMKDWNILNSSERKLLEKVNRVRNDFAHTWNNSEMKHRDGEYGENISQFRKDLSRAIKTIIEKYKKYQPDVKEVIKKAQRFI